jgi:hypothetical protein
VAFRHQELARRQSGPSSAAPLNPEGLHHQRN